MFQNLHVSFSLYPIESMQAVYLQGTMNHNEGKWSTPWGLCTPSSNPRRSIKMFTVRLGPIYKHNKLKNYYMGYYLPTHIYYINIMIFWSYNKLSRLSYQEQTISKGLYGFSILGPHPNKHVEHKHNIGDPSAHISYCMDSIWMFACLYTYIHRHTKSVKWLELMICHCLQNKRTLLVDSHLDRCLRTLQHEI